MGEIGEIGGKKVVKNFHLESIVLPFFVHFNE
jgi:hypothetical protein